MRESLFRDTLAIIPLRAGSKGLRRKNLLPLAGIPLYRHSVHQALRVVGECIISTDISEILSGNPDSACQVIERPAELAQDNTPITPVMMHLFESLKRVNRLPKQAILLQATSPLRRDEDIHNAVRLFKTGEFELVMSVVKTDSGILKYGFTENERFIPISRPDYCFSNRQSLPEIARPNGAIYVFSPDTFLKNGGMPTRSIGSIEMPEAFSIDIDSQADLDAAEEIMLLPSLSKANNGGNHACYR